MAFEYTGTPCVGDSGGDGVQVLAREVGEAVHRFLGVLLGLPDPFEYEGPTSVADQVGERSREIAGPGDVWAGDPDFEELLLLLVGESRARAHDPAGDLSRAGDVGPHGFGIAGTEDGEVFADDLAAAPVATFSNFQEVGAMASPDRR
ncbi:hypothetical protein OG521_00495 [Streptomyces sp. NBC_01463]|nr:hypothetical protein [Streptomyces sp. NBC_01257]WRZ69683.1 hypothetical protein OG408_39835 [Streptomyces sp. NBC_01257]